MGKFEVYQREDGQYGWRLFASNGEEVANDTGQGFRDKHDAWRAVRQAIMAAQDAALAAFDLKTMTELQAASAEGA